MDRKKTNIYLKYFVKEAQPENYDHLPKNSSEEYERVLASVSQLRERRRFKKPQRICKSLSNIGKNKERENSTLDKNKDINILLQAITHDGVESIGQILSNEEYDISINSRDNYLWTPLMCACHRGDVNIIRLLLKKGAKVKVKDAAGNTPLSIAKNCKHSDIFEMLLERMREENSLLQSKETLSQNDQISKDNSSPVLLHVENVNVVTVSINDKNKVTVGCEETRDYKSNKGELVSTESKHTESPSNKGDIISPSLRFNTQVRNCEDQEVICISSDEEKFEIHCSLCNINVVEENFKEHLLSTVHQFYKQLKSMEDNDQKPLKPVKYSLPEENKGFQLLLKSGWSKQSGLGKNQSGIKIPIKTKMKNDKKGVGKINQKSSMHKVLPEYNVKFNPKLKKKIEKSKEILYREEFNSL